MTEDNIRSYLQDNGDLSDQVIEYLVPLIMKKLDYSIIYEQIDCLVSELTC